jgi:hypothetical protein
MAVKINVIWIIDSLGQGGAEHLMPGILSHIDRGRFELRVCSLQERFGNPIAEKIKELGIPVDMVSVPHLRTPGALENLRRYLREHRADVVHTQLEFSDTLGSLAARLEHIPSVSTLNVIPEPSIRSREFWRHRLMWLSLSIAVTVFLPFLKARGSITSSMAVFHRPACKPCITESTSHVTV